MQHYISVKMSLDGFKCGLVECDAIISIIVTFLQQKYCKLLKILDLCLIQLYIEFKKYVLSTTTLSKILSL